MQMAMRLPLVCFVASAHLASGISAHSLRSRTIPVANRVTTVANIVSGVGVVRPPPPAPPAAAGEAPGAGNGAAPGAPPGAGNGLVGPGPPGSMQFAAPPPKPPWKIEAMFEVTTNAPNFLDEYEASSAGFALTIADRLKWATDVPLTRFAFFLPNTGATFDPENVLFCESKYNEYHVGALTARYSSAKNSSMECQARKHKLNSTLPAFLQETGTKALTFEVGVYPATRVDGDEMPGIQVAEEIVSFATSGDEPERKLLPTGLWSYKAGPGVKFHGLFPATSAALMGTPFESDRETALPLGPNPGGHGAEPPPTIPPGLGEAAKKEAQQQAHLADVDTVVHQANEINEGVKNSLQELKDSLARGSAAHAAWMNMNPYKLPAELAG